jgi:NhaP-type Na+/H+ or K+/H+ antiporter
MLMILMPILSRIGYGLRWENMIIMMWGGLRGAVGLCLAIEVFRGELCEAHPKIGPQVGTSNRSRIVALNLEL